MSKETDINEHGPANVTGGIASLKPVTDDPSNPPVFKRKKLRDIIKRRMSGNKQ